MPSYSFYPLFESGLAVNVFLYGKYTACFYAFVVHFSLSEDYMCCWWGSDTAGIWDSGFDILSEC